MRIGAWNIQHGGGRRVDAILQVLDDLRLDVVALTEFRGTPPSRELARGLRALGLEHQESTVDPERPRSNRVLIAGRTPVERHDTPVDEQLLCSTGRWLRCRVPAHGLDVVGVHVPNRDSGHKYDFHDAVLRRMTALADHPVVVAGDTNTGRQHLDEMAPFFNAREHAWFDRIADAGWCDVHPQLHGDDRVCTWRTHRGVGFRLDQVFVSPPLQNRVRSIDHRWGAPRSETGKWPSDHALVVVELSA